MALSFNTPRDYEAGYDREINEMPVKASEHIYEGAAVGDDASGLCRALVAGDPFFGFAHREADNSSGADRAINVRLVQRGAVRLSVAGVADEDDVGKTVYASDDGTFTLTAGANTAVGKIKRYDTGTYCMVAFEATVARSL